MTSRHAVITYHGVGRALEGEDPHELLVSEEAFRAQMAFLARHRNVVPLHALVQGRPRGRKPTVAITFDDAYRSVLHVAAPILLEYGLASTVFAPDAMDRAGERMDRAPVEPLGDHGSQRTACRR